MTATVARAADDAATCAVLVTSCDAYSDLWPPFFQLFNRFWPDCPFPVYLLSNTKSSGFPNVTTIAVGADVSWSDNLLYALDRITQPYVILYIEDQFISAPVIADNVSRLMDWVRRHEPDYVRLIASPGPDEPFDEVAGRVAVGATYRTSTVVCLWKTASLRAIVRRGESAWDFELIGSARSDTYFGFFSLHRDLFPTEHGVIRGRWLPSVARRLRALGATVDTVARPVMRRGDVAAFRLAQVRARMLRLVPPRQRRAVRAALLKLRGWLPGAG